MDARTAEIRQLVESWQTNRKLAAMSGDAGDRFTFGCAGQNDRFAILALVEQIISDLGSAAPRSLREFAVHLQPHQNERKALALWPEVQVDWTSAASPTDSAASGDDPPKPVAGSGKKNVNARMLEAISENTEALGWNSTQWAKQLKCSPVAVVTTQTWKDLQMRREREKAERARDRNRRKRAR